MNPSAVPAGFAQSYAEARGKFLAAAEAAGLDVHAHAHPLVGRDGEALALDVVRDGPADAPAVLIVSSGCHGVEGFCGSGIQVALLGDTLFRDTARAAGVAVLHLHALNPYGFSWWRRTTHENVDLNRNFVDFDAPLPANPGYDALAHLIVPATWPPTPEVEAGLAAHAAEHGPRALQAAVTGGQYRHPQGLFFGGHNPTWSHRVVRQVLREQGHRCQQLAWIDVHTGLGPSGHGERIFGGASGTPASVGFERARRWWGEAVTSPDDGSSSSAPLRGTMWPTATVDCPQAEFTAMALEFGTEPVNEVIDALRSDQWLENHPEVVEDGIRRAIKQRLRDAFYTDTDAWKRTVVAQARDAAFGALRGLSTA